MANKFSDILQMIHNTQIRTAIDKMGQLCGLTSDSVAGTAGALTANVIGDVTGDVTGDLTGDVTGDVTGSTTKLLAASGASNALAATMTFTFTDSSADGEYFEFGADLYEIDIDAGGTAQAGAIAVDLVTGSVTKEDAAAALVTSVNASGTEAFTAINEGAGVVTLLASTRGTASNGVVADDTNAAHCTASGNSANGADGTVGDIGTTIVTPGFLQVAKAANTVADANWRVIPLDSFAGGGVAYSIHGTVAMGNIDFDSDTIFLDGSVACVYTEWTPTPGRTYVLACTDSTADPVITLTSGITLNEAGNDKMTFPDADDLLVIKCISAIRCVILSNEGSVTLATA